MTEELKRKFDLQIFAGDEDGSEAGSGEGNDSDTSAGTENTDTENKEGKQDEGKSEGSEAKDDGKQEENKIPYSRFKEVNEALKQYKKTLEEAGLENPEQIKELVQELKEKKEQEEQKKKEDMDELERLKYELEQESNTKQEYEQKIQEYENQLNNERIYNRFIIQAKQAGIEYVDDAFKLADTSKVKVKKDGTVENVEEVVSNLVENKPYLVSKQEPEDIGGPSEQQKETDDKTTEQYLEELAEKAKKTGRIEDKKRYATEKRRLLGA